MFLLRGRHHAELTAGGGRGRQRSAVDSGPALALAGPRPGCVSLDGGSTSQVAATSPAVPRLG